MVVIKEAEETEGGANGAGEVTSESRDSGVG